jgi:hypothetical protein
MKKAGDVVFTDVDYTYIFMCMCISSTCNLLQ